MDLWYFICWKNKISKKAKEKEYIKKQNKSKDNTQNINNDDITAKLKKLKSLFEEQLITEEEYTTKKQEILNML